MDGFGWRLENLREKSGHTKIDMSLKLGFTANVYGSYEREERRPALETIIKLADIFNVSLDYLIRGEEYHREADFVIAEDKLQYLVQYFNEKGIDEPYFLQHKKWSILSHEELTEISNHFEWVVHKAKNKEDFK